MQANLLSLVFYGTSILSGYIVPPFYKYLLKHSTLSVLCTLHLGIKSELLFLVLWIWTGFSIVKGELIPYFPIGRLLFSAFLCSYHHACQGNGSYIFHQVSRPSCFWYITTCPLYLYWYYHWYSWCTKTEDFPGPPHKYCLVSFIFNLNFHSLFSGCVPELIVGNCFISPNWAYMKLTKQYWHTLVTS